MGQPCGLTTTLTNIIVNPFYSAAGGNRLDVTSCVNSFLTSCPSEDGRRGKRGSFYDDVLNVSHNEPCQHRVERRCWPCCGWERAEWHREALNDPLDRGISWQKSGRICSTASLPSGSQTEKHPIALNRENNFNREMNKHSLSGMFFI